MVLELPADFLVKLSKYGIGTRVKINGHHKGSHRADRFGASLDFSDFREYHAGDDVRLIDWNIYARTDRVYIKRYLDEQEMSVGILLDCSKSMTAKWLFARQLIYSLGMIVLNRDDKLSVTVAGTGIAPFQRKGKTARKRFEQYLTDIAVPAETAFAQIGSRLPDSGSTVLFILSDGLEPLAHWEQLFKRLARKSRDLRFLHITTEEEHEPQARGDIRFVDEETEKAVNVTVGERTLKAYQEKREQHLRALEALCAKYGVRYLYIHAERGIHHALFQQLKEKKWIE